MRGLFNAITVFSAVIMVTAILLQNRGSGLGAGFGGESGGFRSKRGAEKVLHDATIVSAVIFALSVVLGLLSA